VKAQIQEDPSQCGSARLAPLKAPLAATALPFQLLAAG